MENIIENSSSNSQIENFTQLDPNNPSWHWLTSLAVWFSSVFLIGIFQFAFVLSFLVYQNVTVGGFSVTDALTNLQEMDLGSILKTDASAMFWAVSSVIIAHVFTFALAWMVVTRFGKDSFRESLGWSQKQFNVWNSLITVGLFYILAVALTMIFGEQEDEFSRMLKSSREIVYAIAIIATLSAPIVEEVIYRGLIFSSFYKKFGAVVAIVVATMLFAGVHYPQYWGNYAGLIAITTLSFVITMIRFKTKSVLPCIVLHTIFNASQSILLLLQPWVESFSTEPKAAIFYFIK
jgi:uncharacterized protein